MFNPEDGTRSAYEDTSVEPEASTPHAGARQIAKTVSFDAGPPQINEYEMVTPDPSSVASGSREGSYDSASTDSFEVDADYHHSFSPDHEDSFDESLEDTGKTPVLLPEDWRFMSPQAADTGLAETFDDPFEGEGQNESPSAGYSTSQNIHELLSRSDSVNSDGDRRPLPPLPQAMSTLKDDKPSEEPRNSSSSLHPRSLPSPPRPAAISKEEVLGMKDSSMPLQERLRRLSMQSHDHSKDQAQSKVMDDRIEDQAPEDNEGVENNALPNSLEASEQKGPEGVEKRAPPRISRESILRRVKSQHFDDTDPEDSSPPRSPEVQSEYPDYANLDPDDPLPSREPSSNYEERIVDSYKIKVEEDEHRSSLEMYASFHATDLPEQSPSRLEDHDVERAVVHHGSENDDHVRSKEVKEEKENFSQSHDYLFTKDSAHKSDAHRMSLPEFESFGATEDFSAGFRSYMSESPPLQPEKSKDSQELTKTFEECSKQMSEERPSTPLEQLQPPMAFSNESAEEVGTPDSVIHHPTELEPEPEVESEVEPEFSQEETPSVPGRVATVKAPGGKLKTRPSASAAELEELKTQMYHTSDEKPPPIPAKYADEIASAEQRKASLEDDARGASDNTLPNRRQSMRMKLDMPLGSFDEDAGLGIDKEFDRLLEAQKVELYPISSQCHFPIQTGSRPGAEALAGRGYSYHNDDYADLRTRGQRGYLMRQNTKVVVANRTVSNESKESKDFKDSDQRHQPVAERPDPAQREVKSANSSPRKPSGPAFTTEPWNGRTRRRSARRSTINPENGLPGGPVPANIQDLTLGTVNEDHSLCMEDPSGADRGRFFVKVVGAKDLDLPLPRSK